MLHHAVSSIKNLRKICVPVAVFAEDIWDAFLAQLRPFFSGNKLQKWSGHIDLYNYQDRIVSAYRHMSQNTEWKPR